VSYYKEPKIKIKDGHEIKENMKKRIINSDIVFIN
jgi:hypothetical protein